MKVLYLSYDGALDPLGRSQVVPYLEGLSGRGHRFDLLTWEKPGRWRAIADREAMRERLRRSGIGWHPLPYHKRPPVVGTSLDLARGVRLARRLLAKDPTDLIHARSYPAALIAWRLWHAVGTPYLFDMRGLYAEERVDGGLWRGGGFLYRLTRRLEGSFLRDASGVVTLTRASVPEIRGRMATAGGRGLLEVIPTGVDLARFASLPPSGGRTIAYVGSIGTWYLLSEMLAFSKVVLETWGEASILFLVNENPEGIARAAAGAGIPAAKLRVASVPHEKVPEALADAAATFHFIHPAPSKIASAATKFAESLALGLPVVVNRGIGDAASIVEADRVGVVIDGFEDEGYRRAVARLRDLVEDPGARARCRASAETHFSMEAAVELYDGLYRAIGSAP